uniref:Ig-like domain-containing protein n=1 Tax=Ascaris lumbricoides TaxID=6252 RepID=A0A9J2PGD5_ASCLU
MLKIIILVAENIQSTSFSQLVIHFSDVIAGGEFKQLVMDDIRKAFSRMRERELDTDTESEKQVPSGIHVFTCSAPKCMGNAATLSDTDDQTPTDINESLSTEEVKLETEVHRDGQRLTVKEERSSQGPQEVALGIRPLTPESTQRSGYLSTVSIDGSAEGSSQSAENTICVENGSTQMKEQTVVELNGNSEKRSFPAGPGLYVPHALFDHLMGDLLRPLAKVQSLGSGNLLFAIRNRLLALGNNGGLERLDIARELSNPGYWREVKLLWENFSQGKAVDFEFAFTRLISFLYWTQSNLDSVTDLGELNVEMLMLCRNSRWHETADARKRYDFFMREVLMKMDELIAVRNWCGVIREKTVLDLAGARAERLSTLDLGTTVVKAPFGKWNLRRLFRELGNLTDFTWLNCDLRALIELRSVEKLKRLVLHITKFDQIFYKQFFARFGWKNIEDDYEIIEADRRYSDDIDVYDINGYDSSDSFIDDRDEEDISVDQDTSHDTSSQRTSDTTPTVTDSKASESVAEGLEMTVNLRCFLAASRSKKQSTQQWIKDYGESTVDVQLEFVALSFAFTQYRTQNVFDFNRNANLDIFAEIFRVPRVVLMANSIALNVPYTCLREALDKVGNRQLKMFSVGIPQELCANIHPNRTPFPDVIRILENMSYFVNRDWKHKDVRLHVMVDTYLPDRVARLLDRVIIAFQDAERIRIHVETARKADRAFYRCPRTRWVYAIRPMHLRVFELTIDCLVFRLPEELWAISCPTLEEFHMTLSGIRAAHNGFGKNNLMSLLGALLNANINPRIHTIVFKLNAPLFFGLCERFREPNANRIQSLRTLGFVCLPSLYYRSSRIVHEIEMLYLASSKRLERLILDPRVWGELDPDQMAYLQDVMSGCTFDAQLAPDDCKYINVEHCKEAVVYADDSDYCDESDVRSESPCLDEGGDEVLLCSDYSDSGILPLDEASQSSTQEITLIRKAKHDSETPSKGRSSRSRRIESDDGEDDADKPGPSGLNQRSPPLTRRINYAEDSDDVYDNDPYLTPKKKRRRRKNCGTSESEDDSWNESSCRKRKAPKSRGKTKIASSRSVAKRLVNLRSDDAQGIRSKRISSGESEITKKSRRRKSRRNRGDESDEGSRSSQSDEWTPKSRRQSKKIRTRKL